MSNNNDCGKQSVQSNKPKFDKKKWREKKYSNKYKVEKWEKKREKALVRQYYKELKKDPAYAKRSQPRVDESASPEVQLTVNTTKKKKFNSYEAARAEIRKRREEKQKQIDERAERKKEMVTKLAEYRKKRADRYRVLSKKNVKGQPVMKGRLQLLYQQIHQASS